jgi:type VI protein secretion system component Hcp
MDSKRVGSSARRRLVWAAGAAGLIAVTAVVASSVAGAEPFIPNVPGFAQPTALEGSVVLGGLRFPALYASEGISGTGGCSPGKLGCKPSAHGFTLTKLVDSTTPVLAQSAATGERFNEALIVINSGKGPAITYKLSDVTVADDHQQFETSAASPGNATLKELVTLSYSKIEWSVGSVKTCYDWFKAAKC